MPNERRQIQYAHLVEGLTNSVDSRIGRLPNLLDCARMARRRNLQLVSLLALAACAGCPIGDDPGREDTSNAANSRASQLRPNIVMIVVCSLRRSHLGFAGYERATSPFIDTLVARGTPRLLLTGRSADRRNRGHAQLVWLTR